MREVEDPVELVELFERDPETHLYGLADLEEPYWSNSTWYVDGQAAVGLVSVGTEWRAGYAMSRVAVDDTLSLFARAQMELEENSWVTGATGLYERLRGIRACQWIGPHWRMILEEPLYVEHDFDVTELGAGDVATMESLTFTDPDSTFWLPGMLADNPFVGVWEDGVLLATAGCHVASDRFGVAAIGAVFAHPEHRGRGLGAIATSELLDRIVSRYEVIGLNVATSNLPAVRIYDRLGFRREFAYEEIELL